MAPEPKQKKKKAPKEPKNQFRFQITKEAEALVARAAEVAGDVSPQAFAHRAVLLLTRAVLEAGPPERRLMHDHAAELLRAGAKES